MTSSIKNIVKSFKINDKYTPLTIVNIIKENVCEDGSICGYLPKDFFTEFKIDFDRKKLTSQFIQVLKFRIYLEVLVSWIKNDDPNKKYLIDFKDIKNLMIFLCEVLISIYGGLYFSVFLNTLNLFIKMIDGWSKDDKVFEKYNKKLKQLKTHHQQ